MKKQLLALLSLAVILGIPACCGRSCDPCEKSCPEVCQTQEQEVPVRCMKKVTTKCCTKESAPYFKCADGSELSAGKMRKR